VSIERTRAHLAAAGAEAAIGGAAPAPR